MPRSLDMIQRLLKTISFGGGIGQHGQVDAA